MEQSKRRINRRQLLRGAAAAALGGLGAAGAPRLVPAQAPAVHRELERIGATLAGQSLQSALEFAPALANRIASRPEAAALSALDQALWDLAAQVREQPLAALLGPKPQSAIALYANINRGTLDRGAGGRYPALRDGNGAYARRRRQAGRSRRRIPPLGRPIGDRRPGDDRDIVFRRGPAEDHHDRAGRGHGHGQPDQSPRKTIS